MTQELAPLPESPPDFLSDEAKEEYSRLAPELAKLGHVSSLNLQSLVNYCEAFSLVKEAREKLGEYGFSMSGEKGGGRYINPDFAVWTGARSVMEKEAKNLGMTPASLQAIKSARQPQRRNADGPSAFLPGMEATG